MGNKINLLKEENINNEKGKSDTSFKKDNVSFSP
jgi:hypothetical protein